MSCCPPSRCPALDPSKDYKAKGKEVKIGGIDAYVVGEGKKGAVIVVADIFGWQSGRHKAIADTFADEGYYAIMPDLFHGDKCEFKDLDTPRLREFLLKFKPSLWQVIENTKPDMDTVYKHLNEKKIDPKSIGMIGFCWGCWAIYHESARSGNKFSCGANFHPSLAIEGFFKRKIEDLADKVNNPMLMGPCKDDPEAVKEKGSVHEILLKKSFGKAVEYVTFPDMEHGFSSQGDVSDKKIAAEVDKAFKAAIAFFSKNLSV